MFLLHSSNQQQLKIFLEYHRTNCHIKFENIMQSFATLSEDLKLPCKKCGKRFKSKEDLEQHNVLYQNILTSVGFPKAKGRPKQKLPGRNQE